MAIEDQQIAGEKIELLVIHFKNDKMTLRVPTANAKKVGLRKLADEI
jgi:CarD family transcriptional regulator